MNRFVVYGIIIVLVVGGFLAYWLYEQRQRNRDMAEGFKRQAEQIERMQGR